MEIYLNIMPNFREKRLLAKLSDAMPDRLRESGSGVEQDRSLLNSFVVLRQEVVDKIVGLSLEERENQLVGMDPNKFKVLNEEQRLYLVTGLMPEQLRPGQKVEITFGGNYRLERAVGLHDLLPKGMVHHLIFDGKIYFPDWKGDFYCHGKYLAIGENTQIIVGGGRNLKLHMF